MATQTMLPVPTMAAGGRAQRREAVYVAFTWLAAVKMKLQRSRRAEDLEQMEPGDSQHEPIADVCFQRGEPQTNYQCLSQRF